MTAATFPSQGSLPADPGRTAESIALLHRIFSETATGDSALFLESLAEDICWIVRGTSSWSRAYRGKQSVIEDLLKPLRRKLDKPNHVTALRIFGEGDLFIVEATGDAVTRSGMPYRNGYCLICRIADGKIVELIEYADTALIDSVLGPPDQAECRMAFAL